MSAVPQEAGPDAELRILSGCHAGARAPLAGRPRIGAGDDCDIILSDIDLPSGAGAWLQATGGHWHVASAEPQANDADNNAANDAWVPPMPWGRVATLGGIALTVSAAHAPWQAVPDLRPLQEPSPQPPAQEAPDAPAAPVKAAAPAPVAVPPAPPRRRAARSAVVVIGLALAVLMLGVLASLAGRSPAAPASHAVAATPAAPVVDAARQQQLLRDIQRALATVDPGLRLHIDPLPDGRARVGGWVAGIEQFDRVAEALAAVRPVPVLAVRTASDLLDDLGAVGSATGAPLRFELLGAGRVRASGLVLTAEEQTHVLAQLRERVPAGIEIVDGLRVAQAQGPAIQDWLRQAGFAGADARWDAGQGQMAVALDVAPAQRPVLENLLARPGIPLAGLPFTLRIREVAQPPSTAKPPPAPVHASAAPLPFRIRSVVSGPAPYVVLGDGTKLQPGGRRSGWRLAAIEPDRLVFDSPRSLVVLR